MAGVMVRLAMVADVDAWAEQRAELWPQLSEAEHAVEAVQWIRDPNTAALLAIADDGTLLGFVEVGLRAYAEGCETSPVGYVEGWFVDRPMRRMGIGKLLMRAAEDWARAKGCTEIASDTELHNTISQDAHERLGYERVETIVAYRRGL
jgi:aminoglycoside 6'-N-acetyltransferase I